MPLMLQGEVRAVEAERGNTSWQKASSTPPAARGEDVADTHRRIKEIYKRLGLRKDQPRPSVNRGCGCEPSQRSARPEPLKLKKPPVLPAVLGYVLIGVVLAAMLIPLILALRSTRKELAIPQAVDHPMAAETPAELAPLPWEVTLGACRALIKNGQLPEAYATLHRLTLLALADARALSLDATITNWEYVRRLSSRPEERRLLSQITIAAEQSVLGQKPPDVQRYAELETLLCKCLPNVAKQGVSG